VQLAPFSLSLNPGGVHKVWLIPTSRATISGSDPKVLIFASKDAKTDNFKVTGSAPPPPGSCAPSSSLSVLVSGTNVTSYVPKGSWIFGTSGVSVVNVEGTSITNTLIPTANTVNSCASNPVTGTTVCTANNNDVYLLSGTTLGTTLSSGASGFIGFSGGSCTNCGVAMDAVHNKALIGMSTSGGAGFQFLNLATNLFEPTFATQSGGNISEDPLLDPIRNLVLSPNESNNYEIINVATTTSPSFFEHAIPSPPGEADSSAEDCSTGIIAAPMEFSGPSGVYLADISNPTFAPFTAGTPGFWAAPEQVQSLSDSFLAAGASGMAIAQGTATLPPLHQGVVSGEFGGDTLTAVQLPSISGGGAIPAITDWVTCSIGSGFNMGFDPHTLTAYESPADGHAIALLANDSATVLARVDLTAMLNTTTVPRVGNACASGPLPASVVSFISVP
jgi:hypothetical protein